jgi:hypothetical protein
MGITVDHITLQNGQVLSNAYVSFRFCNINLHCIQNENKTSANSWMITTTYGICPDESSPPIENRLINCELTDDDLNQPVFTYLYTKVKNQFN